MLAVERWLRQARDEAWDTAVMPARRPATQLSFQLVPSNLSSPRIMNCSFSYKFKATNEWDGKRIGCFRTVQEGTTTENRDNIDQEKERHQIEKQQQHKNANSHPSSDMETSATQVWQFTLLCLCSSTTTNITYNQFLSICPTSLYNC